MILLILVLLLLPLLRMMSPLVSEISVTGSPSNPGASGQTDLTLMSVLSSVLSDDMRLQVTLVSSRVGAVLPVTRIPHTKMLRLPVFAEITRPSKALLTVWALIRSLFQVNGFVMFVKVGFITKLLTTDRTFVISLLLMVSLVMDQHVLS